MGSMLGGENLDGREGMIWSREIILGTIPFNRQKMLRTETQRRWNVIVFLKKSEERKSKY